MRGRAGVGLLLGREAGGPWTSLDMPCSSGVPLEGRGEVAPTTAEQGRPAVSGRLLKPFPGLDVGGVHEPGLVSVAEDLAESQTSLSAGLLSCRSSHMGWRGACTRGFRPLCQQEQRARGHERRDLGELVTSQSMQRGPGDQD